MGETVKRGRRRRPQRRARRKRRGKVGKAHLLGQSKPNAHSAMSPGIKRASVYRVTLDRVLQGARRVIM